MIHWTCIDSAEIMRFIGLKCLIWVSLLWPACREASAQTEEQRSHVDFFSGVDFNYRNIHFNDRLYDLLINLTPGVKWHMGRHWQLAASGLVPVVNQYGDRYKKVRLDVMSLSKELFLPKRQFLKVSGGLFGGERYGVDVKWMFPVNAWLAFDGQVGLTGYCSMARDWECSRMERLTGTLGARAYLTRYNTELRLYGGRYIFEDYGATGECMRHFRHCTVGVYAQYSDRGKENGGFKIVMMIPPYTRRTRKVNVRPASNFRLTYNAQADPYSMRTYITDPEENEREGNFDRGRLKWGSNGMEADFKEKGGGL